MDERGNGIHSHIYKKSIIDFQFKNKIKNLGIIGEWEHFQLQLL